MLLHVNPCIPDSVEVLVKYIKSKLMLDIDGDTMRYLRIDPTDDELIHVVSHRRYFFTEINKDKLPGRFVIEYNNKHHHW